MSSLLGGTWDDLKTLLFAVSGGNLERARELVGPYIRECGNTRQTPSVRELLTFIPNGTATRPRNGAHVHPAVVVRNNVTSGRKIV